MSDVNKAARDYLKASGAGPISVVAIDGVCSFQAKIDPNAVAVYWLCETEAAAVIKTARQIAGKSCPDVDAAVAALHRAAADNRATLTPNATALDRAAIAANKL